MIPLPTPKTETARQLVKSIYEICIFGNGTVNPVDQKLAKLGLKPSYMHAKWFHFNNLGLSALKVENAALMFVAQSSILIVDVLILPIAKAGGIGEIRVIPILMDIAKLIIAPIPKFVLQEYLERQFEKEMFDPKQPRFLNEVQKLEKNIIEKHSIDFTLSDSHLNILKKFTARPMLNYIFFQYQMTEEYKIYRKHYPNKYAIQFNTKEDATRYLTTIFRMLRFNYFIEIHALNYFFNHVFESILNFYLTTDSLRDKYIKMFSPEKKYVEISDTKRFFAHLNFKVQKNRNAVKIKQEFCEETGILFQNFYFSFFFNTGDNYKYIIPFLNSSEMQEFLEISSDDSIRLKRLFELAIDAAKGKISSHINDVAVGPLMKKMQPLTEKFNDIPSFVLSVLMQVKSTERSKQFAGAGAIIGLSALLGGAIACGFAGYKYRGKIVSHIEKMYEKIFVPAVNFFQTIDQKFNELFSLHSTVVNSETNQVLGSILFFASHIPGFAPAAPVLEMFVAITAFNPISSFIMRTAEQCVKLRLQEYDLTILNKIDRLIRIGYASQNDSTLTIKVFNFQKRWVEDIEMDFVTDAFLTLFTKDFARVVRHQSQIIGTLLEDIAFLDREIQTFQHNQIRDYFYMGRENNKPVYTPPLARVTSPVTHETIVEKSKERFFDILIERQSLLMNLINRSYYVTLYNLFMNKLNEKCQSIFKDHLPHALEKIDHLA